MSDAELFSSLKTVFHEPSRLAAIAALAAAGEDGLAFPELCRQTELTCGNLNRHLKVLEDAGVIAVEKRFVALKPRTDVFLTDAGKTAFMDYLESLERALKAAESSLRETPAIIQTAVAAT